MAVPGQNWQDALDEARGGSGSGYSPTPPRSGPQMPQLWSNIFVDTSNPAGIDRASNPGSGLWTRDVTVDQAESWFNALDPQMRGVLGAVATGLNTNARGLWNDYVSYSSELANIGIFKDPLTLFWEEFGPGGVNDTTASLSTSSGGYYGGGSYGGGGGGTTATVNLSNEEDARAVINQLATQMLGRTVSEREFKKYFQALRDLESANPQTVTFGTDADGNPATVVEGGLGAEGRQAALMDSLRSAKDYNEYTIGSRAVDLMGQYLQERGVFSG